MKTKLINLCLPATLAACQIGDGMVDYYGDGSAPEISGLSVTAEYGNVGGGNLVISGSNFGGDPQAVTVVFGSQNARILRVDGSEIEIEVPNGPIEGGAVDVKVGTPEGQAVLEDGYLYDVDSMFGQEGFYDKEIAYLAITNDYFSCFGGVGHPTGDCSGWAISGSTGLDGQGEFLEFVFGRVHAPYTGYRNGFGGTTDLSWENWAVEMPPYDLNTFDLEDLYADLRLEVDSFSVRNLDAAAIYAAEGDDTTVCQDMRGLADIYTEGYTERIMATADCDQDPYGKAYDITQVDFCQIEDYELARSYRYAPEWPVGEYFFNGANPAGRLDEDYPAVLEMSVPELGIEGATFTVPPYSVFYGVEGFAYDAWKGYWEDVYSETDLQTLSLIFGMGLTCPDSNNNGKTEADDRAAVWEWEPVDWADVLDKKPHGPAVVDFRTFVRVSINYYQDGWLGLSGNPVRLTITVPDDYNFDERTGMSSVELPASVLYQLPSAMQDKGENFLFAGLGMSSATGWYPVGWGDPTRPDYGMLFSTIERVTEYKIARPEGGYLLVAYSTGDVGYTAYATHATGQTDEDGNLYYDTSFVNIATTDNVCLDCDDNDDDGWIDVGDPDCLFGGSVEQGYSDYLCNDGLDNDLDGDIDADDDGCADAMAEETNCLDGRDNDGDGWIDDDDPECDGGFGMEEGYGDTACNDGEDNDGHGDVDALDYLCLVNGAEYDAEQPEFADDCADDTDNDGDGYIDANDPDCEVSPYDAETDAYWKSAELLPACYNGLDDDGDGNVDAEDPGCVNGEGEPDGFVNDETD